METVVAYFLPIYFVVYFAAAFFWRSYRIRKSTGVNPYALGDSDTTHDYVGRLFRLVLVASFVVVGIRSFWSAGYPYLASIAWMQHPALVYAGLGLLVISLLWTVLAQEQMGVSWRIGIDTRHLTDLVQTGVFAWSRNPIFLGLRVTVLGLFLVLPNAATLVILVLGNALMQIQVRLEEEFLAKIHDARYEEYRQRVRRWL